ncbi:zinc finger protein 501-like [Entelurus aequoreus]|uniref:zinc finger protein 501-like n=1 Tax=Entelurus aequoreus TaxID=161455 RepID=UPI002B1DCC53|nr:zinc finger protein 501-like [Entelurus aequoreus]
MLKELVKERLMAAADEIFALFERTIASYEEELSRTREKERHPQQPEAVCKTPFVLHNKDVRQPIGPQEEHAPQLQEGMSTLKQEDPQPPYIKEEAQQLWIAQEGEADLGPLQVSGVSLRTEDHEEKPESWQLHRSPSEEDRGAEPSGSCSSQHITEGGAPLSESEDITSNSLKDENRGATQQPLSGDTDCEGDIRTPTDNKHSEYCKKKTGKEGLTHTGEKPLSCPVFRKGFSQRSKMKSHVRNFHAEKMYICSVCGDVFPLHIQLTRHMEKHTEIPFSCSVCDERFLHRAELVSHVAIHEGETSFKGSACDQSFPTVAQFDTHMTTHTGEKNVCPVCGKTLASAYYLSSHMRSHTREKPFRCSVCARNFGRRSSLNVHMRIHTGEKPFSCSVCAMNFAHRSSLNTHMQTHTGQKPFSCLVCAKSFTRNYCLKVHMRIHT